MAGDHGQIEPALNEFEQAAGLGFDQFFLALRQELGGQRALVLHGVRDEALQLHAL